MFTLNEKIKNLTPYEPISGQYRIRLDANESFLSPDEALQDAIRRAVDSVPFRRYPDPLAAELRAGAAAYYGVAPELICAGGKPGFLPQLTHGSFQTGFSGNNAAGCSLP